MRKAAQRNTEYRATHTVPSEGPVAASTVRRTAHTPQPGVGTATCKLHRGAGRTVQGRLTAHGAHFPSGIHPTHSPPRRPPRPAAASPSCQGGARAEINLMRVQIRFLCDYMVPGVINRLITVFPMHLPNGKSIITGTQDCGVSLGSAGTCPPI